MKQEKYDYLIVGTGLFGSVIARQLTDAGYSCLVIDKRDHTGGNCYTQNIGGINIHKYGPHIFHTNNKQIFEYVQKYSNINNFTCRPKLRYKDKIYSLPINLMTLNQIWGVVTPEEAKNKLDLETRYYKRIYSEPKNSYEWGLAHVGETLFNIFYKDYLIKQWGRDPREIPPEVLQRQVFRLDFNDSYYYDYYQGIPNYTQLFGNLLKGIEVITGIDYLKNKEMLDKIYTKKLIYSGPIDEFYGYKFGILEYRSLKFEEELLSIPDYQGVFMVSYPELKYDFTRIIEHKHFEFGTQDFTIITREYPDTWDKTKIAYYPVNDNKNQIIYNRYYEYYLKEDPNIIFGGRLGSYKYLNMDQTIELALETVKKLI